MDVKKTLLDIVSGAGEAGKTVVSASRDIVKEGAGTVGDLVHAVFEIAKETGKDAEELTKEVVMGAVDAVKETVGQSQDATAGVLTEAEKAAGDLAEEGGEAVRKGVAKAKEILQEPLK